MRVHYLRSSAGDAAGSEKRSTRLEAAWKSLEAAGLTLDELLIFHERVGQLLSYKLQSISSKMRIDQQELQTHLSKLRSGLVDLNGPESDTQIKPARRPYPTVYPKYRSLKDPSQTWAGRGKKPRWLIAEMKDGKTMNDFLIAKPTGKGRKKPR